MEISKISTLIKDDIESFISDNSYAKFQDRGIVIKVMDGVATVSGLRSGSTNELVDFSSGAKGMIFNLEEDSVDIVILTDEQKVKEGDEVSCTKSSLKIKCGVGMAGRVIDPLGNPIDGLGEIPGTLEEREVEPAAPSIIDRDPVNVPMETGVKIVDGLIPIGRGQRELIIGDRQTGKTSIAISAIVNQAKINKERKEKVYSVYVAIGQRLSAIAQLKQYLVDVGAMEYTTIVVAGASDSASLQFIAPYSACAIAEHFRDNGMHALIVYDDLSKHAVAYRQMSLLLRRSPGREAYPGDVFYIHSRLLERAAQMSKKNGGGSLTALPIVETQAGDMSAYIPTNIISITDGQIFLESDLMNKKILPAINVGLSVSRVGSTAQPKAISSVAGRMKLELAQYREMESFAQFASDLDSSTQYLLHKGRCLIELLKQNNLETFSMAEQVIVLSLGAGKYLDNMNTDKITKLHDHVISAFRSKYKDLLQNITKEKKLNDKLTSEIDKALTDIISSVDMDD